MNKLLLTIICIVLTISTATASDVVFKFAEGSCYEVVGASSRSDRSTAVQLLEEVGFTAGSCAEHDYTTWERVEFFPLFSDEGKLRIDIYGPTDPAPVSASASKTDSLYKIDAVSCNEIEDAHTRFNTTELEQIRYMNFRSGTCADNGFTHYAYHMNWFFWKSHGKFQVTVYFHEPHPMESTATASTARVYKTEAGQCWEAASDERLTSVGFQAGTCEDQGYGKWESQEMVPVGERGPAIVFDIYRLSTVSASLQGKITMYKIENGVCGETYDIPSKYKKQASKNKGLKEGTCASIGYTIMSTPATKKVKTLYLGTITFHRFEKPAEEVVSASWEDTFATVYKLESGKCGETEIPSKYVKQASGKGMVAGTCASVGYTVVSTPATKTVKTFMLGNLVLRMYETSPVKEFFFQL